MHVTDPCSREDGSGHLVSVKVNSRFQGVPDGKTVLHISFDYMFDGSLIIHAFNKFWQFGSCYGKSRNMYW